MEQEQVKAEAEAAPSESADGALAETKETEEASPFLPVWLCLCECKHSARNMACMFFILGFGHQPTFQTHCRSLHVRCVLQLKTAVAFSCM